MQLSHSLRSMLFLISACFLTLGVHAGPRLERIRAEGLVVCGVATKDPGFSQRTEQGAYVGLEPDLCRALALTILGSASRVQFRPLETVHEFLADTRVDIVFHRLSWTLSREAPGQLEFGPVYFYEPASDGALEPQAPLLRSDDADFARVVRWSVVALLDAEAKGVDQQVARQHPVVTWPPADSGAWLGLDPHWALRMVAALGHYGEIYGRHFGAGSSRPLARGPNRLQRDGGLFLPPLLR